MAAQKKNSHGITKEMCQMITPEFRVSFPHLYKAQAPKPTDKPKYSVTMLFPKDKKIVGETVEGEKVSLLQIIKNAKIKEFGAEENWPDDLESPVIDGDQAKFTDKKSKHYKEGYAGHWVIKATSNEESKPGLVDEEMIPISNQADFYPGCYARAYVFARVWEYMGKQGVQFIVDHVQKLRDGKSFGGKKPIDQVFKPHVSEDETDADESEEMNF